MISEIKILVIASKVRNPISGRLKVLLNWTKGFKSKLIIIKPTFNLEDLKVVSSGVNIEIVNQHDAKLAIENFGPSFVFIDDRDFDILNLLKDYKIISYIYPIHGLWAMPGLTTSHLIGLTEKTKVKIYRTIPHFKLRNKYQKFKKYSSTIIAQSYTSSGILRYYYGLNPSMVLYNPVDRSIFKPMDSIEKKISSNEITMFLGSNNGDTDLNLVKKVSRISKNYGLTLNTFGYEKNLQYALENNRETIYFKKISDSNLANILSRSHAVILPQVDEPASYVGIESISCGTPVISCYVDESIVPSISGYISTSELFEKFLNSILSKGIEKTLYEKTIGHSALFDNELEARKLISFLKFLPEDD
jgi:glycosyltransferase involved in cell wall biosynthesis